MAESETTVLGEQAIESFEASLEGRDGAIAFRKARATLDEAEGVLRKEMARGLTLAEAEKKKIMMAAIAQGRDLLESVWEDIQRKKQG